MKSAITECKAMPSRHGSLEGVGVYAVPRAFPCGCRCRTRCTAIVLASFPRISDHSADGHLQRSLRITTVQILFAEKKFVAFDSFLRETRFECSGRGNKFLRRHEVGRLPSASGESLRMRSLSHSDTGHDA